MNKNCPICGASMNENAKFCPSCGADTSSDKHSSMACPKCGSTNTSIQFVQTGGKTRKRGRGIMWEIGRAFLIICTCGLWLLVGKSKGKSKTKFKNEKICVCQSCGYSWKIK